jgi:hypothetical protein
MTIQILTGHVSQATAYLVEDYPYGYTLRCKIRYWLEVKDGKGVRFVSQTTNPKKFGEVWNKPKASTYARFGGAMYLDDNDHVQWSGLNEYSDAKETAAWLEKYGAGNVMPELTARWLRGKLAYEAAKAAGDSMAVAAAKAHVAMVKPSEVQS